MTGQTEYTHEQIEKRRQFMAEFETTYADGEHQTGMGNRDKEFMDNITVDLHKIPATIKDPAHEFDNIQPKINAELVKPPFKASELVSGAQQSHSEAYRHFVAMWDHVPDNVTYGGQAAVPQDVEYDISKVPELEKQVEEKRAALEDAAKRMTPEEYNYLMHKRDPRPEAMPQTAEQKRKEMEFVRSFEGVQHTS